MDKYLNLIAKMEDIIGEDYPDMEDDKGAFLWNACQELREYFEGYYNPSLAKGGLYYAI